MKQQHSENWGGIRPNAGRPNLGRVKKVIYVTDEEFEKIKEFINKLREAK